jgi:hypothetical protein
MVSFLSSAARTRAGASPAAAAAAIRERVCLRVVMLVSLG